MTPCSNPGAGAPAARPPAATPRAQGAPVAGAPTARPPAAAPRVLGAPRPVTSSYVNLGSAVTVRAAPTPQMQMQAAAVPRAPGIHAYPRAAGAATARPRMPLPQMQGAPAAGVLPRPMGRGNLGGASMSLPTALKSMPPMQAASPGNARPVGAAVLSARPRMPMPHTQPAPAVVNPAAPSPSKRPPTTVGPAIPPAKRHAPPQGASTGGMPVPTNPDAVARAPAPPQHAQGAPGDGTPSQTPQPMRWLGVHHDPSKGWMARVMDPKRGVRDIGPFDDEHVAALAHDRVAIACAGRGGGRARVNFMKGFYRTEITFLHRWEGDICDAVENGSYEECYAKFLRAGYRAALSIEMGDDGDEQQIVNCVDREMVWDVILEFFIERPGEIGDKALDEGGGLLVERFVEMYRNMALSPLWRGEYHQQLMQAMLQKQIQMQQQQQQQIQMQQQQQIQMQQQQQIQMQQHQIQMQQQHQHIQMQQQQQQQQHIQMQQQQHMMIQKQQQNHPQREQQQQQMMIIQQQQQQQRLEGDAILQVKQELS